MLNYVTAFVCNDIILRDDHSRQRLLTTLRPLFEKQLKKRQSNKIDPIVAWTIHDQYYGLQLVGELDSSKLSNLDIISAMNK